MGQLLTGGQLLVGMLFVERDYILETANFALVQVL